MPKKKNICIMGITIVLYITNQIIKTKIPIERMQLVDYYDADDFLSIEHNNTSAFNYRESTDVLEDCQSTLWDALLI